MRGENVCGAAGRERGKDCDAVLIQAGNKSKVQKSAGAKDVKLIASIVSDKRNYYGSLHVKKKKERTTGLHAK